MSNGANKPIRSPSYPSMPLRDAVDAVAKIEGPYRSSPVDRENAAKLIGYSGLSGPANSALAALAAYGLLDRAGKGQARVTERARAILHPKNEDERKSGLRAAALEPSLFREIREHFDGLPVPPEDGVVTYLNRQGFNPNAIRPAAKAFLQTMAYLEELGATESHGDVGTVGSESDGSDEGNGSDKPTFGGARVGDLVQWESQGVRQFRTPRRVRFVTEDGNWIAVEGSETGIAMNEVIVEERGTEHREQPPIFSFEEDRGAGTDLRFMVGKKPVRVSSPEELGVNELERLAKLINAQTEALKD